MSQPRLTTAELALCYERSEGASAVLAADSLRVLAVTDRYLELLQCSREHALDHNLLTLWQGRLPQAELQDLLASVQTGTPLMREGARPALADATGASTFRERVLLVSEGRAERQLLIHSLEGPLPFEKPSEPLLNERAHDLEQTNERLLQEIALHMKTQHALKRSEEQLIQAQRLDALGRLAGGIAHDFNNLLSVIIGYSSTLVFEAGISPSVRTQITEIRKAGERAADLTMQLLAFSRRQVLEPRVVNLNTTLMDIESMLRRLLGEDIEFNLLCNPQLGRVRVDPGQLEQVILNLVVNARDAMPTGGRLTISTSNTELDEAYTHDHLGTTPGPHVVLTVSDTGCGMDKATQTRIFEPFFTTKEPGKGTGLGLSTAFGIVKQSGGSIWVYSEVGSGTTFSVFFPRVDLSSDRPVASADVEQQGSELILLVEDEPQVRAVACSILRRVGYQVLEAENLQQALECYQDRSDDIQLLITDVVMPGVSGKQVAERLRTLKPDLKVLFMSGYTSDAVLRHGVNGSGTSFLQKPLTSIALTKKVREVLDG